MGKSITQVNTDFNALPNADSISNGSWADVIGNKADVANSTTAQASIIALLRSVLAATGGSTGTDVTAIKAVTDLLPDAGADRTMEIRWGFTHKEQL